MLISRATKPVNHSFHSIYTQLHTATLLLPERLSNWMYNTCNLKLEVPYQFIIYDSFLGMGGHNYILALYFSWQSNEHHLGIE